MLSAFSYIQTQIRSHIPSGPRTGEAQPDCCSCKHHGPCHQQRLVPAIPGNRFCILLHLQTHQFLHTEQCPDQTHPGPGLVPAKDGEHQCQDQEADPECFPHLLPPAVFANR